MQEQTVNHKGINQHKNSQFSAFSKKEGLQEDLQVEAHTKKECGPMRDCGRQRLTGNAPPLKSAPQNALYASTTRHSNP